MPRATILLPLLLALATPAHAAGWQPATRTVTYAITGDTGLALYRSIGEHGPEIGGRRVIAHTRFDLTWTRRYRPQADGSCVLAVAVPHLTVTTTLPKAEGDLPPAVGASWSCFVAGVSAHEKVHGGAIVDMVTRIADVSAGLSAPVDPGCRKVRARLQAYPPRPSPPPQESAAFDKTEWGEDGAMRRLAEALVDGP